MDFGESSRASRIQGHGDFLNIASFWCMFEARDERAAYELASWLNEASGAVDATASLASVELGSEQTARARALVHALEPFTSLLVGPPRTGTWGERRQREKEWRDFRSVAGQWVRDAQGFQDVAIEPELGLGSLAHKYPWYMRISYHPVGQPGDTRHVTAWFVADPIAALTERYFLAMQSQLRASLQLLQKANAGRNGEQLESTISGLLLV